MITKWIFFAWPLARARPTPGAGGWTGLDALQWGSASQLGSESSFLWAALQPSFEDGRTFALACLKLGETAFKGSGF